MYFLEVATLKTPSRYFKKPISTDFSKIDLFGKNLEKRNTRFVHKSFLDVQIKYQNFSFLINGKLKDILYLYVQRK